MNTVELINKSDKQDKKILEHFTSELLKKEKYKNLRTEIEKRNLYSKNRP